MGCDIHLYLERKIAVKGTPKWVGLGEVRGTLSTRNYGLFAELASVRGQSSRNMHPLGIPADASELVAFSCDDSGQDGHSHSWCTVREMVLAYAIAKGTADELVVAALENDTRCVVRQFEKLTEFWMNNDDSAHEYRFVFWFDN